MSPDPKFPSRLAAIALSHVRREYPNHPGHVLTGPTDAAAPRSLHPIFYGSFDWHSCVHSFWLLATLYRLFPDIAQAGAIREFLYDALAPEKVAAEAAYLSRPASHAFERPYGWAWLLMLQAELLRQGGHAGWAAALRPLSDVIVERFRAWLPRATYPVRSGTHGNTAFALRLVMEYARAAADGSFAELLRATALRWYSADADCQCWEPCGEDFLSPSLTEAQCMGAILPDPEFRTWFKNFLPRLTQGEPRTLLQPVYVSDRSDGRIVHLDGLNLSRAWSWDEIASHLDPADPVRALALAAAEQHRQAALGYISGDYMGEHWLATYALLASGVATPTHAWQGEN